MCNKLYYTLIVINSFGVFLKFHRYRVIHHFWYPLGNVMVYWVRLKKTYVAWTLTMATQRQMECVGPVGKFHWYDAYDVHVQNPIMINATLSFNGEKNSRWWS